MWFYKLELTAPFTRLSLYEFACMGFGLCTTFSWVRNLVLPGPTWNIILAFLDNGLVLDKDFEDQLSNL